MDARSRRGERPLHVRVHRAGVVRTKRRERSDRSQHHAWPCRPEGGEACLRRALPRQAARASQGTPQRPEGCGGDPESIQDLEMGRRRKEKQHRDTHLIVRWAVLRLTEGKHRGARPCQLKTWSYVDNLMRPESSWSSFINRGRILWRRACCSGAPLRGVCTSWRGCDPLFPVK
jgi:hypothetical protein